eukprot:scaffold17628_cov77-Cyclotella_meneghiniana.AAC.4
MKEAIMNMFDAPMPFALIAFCALSIERLLYSYCYIFTDHFKSSVDQNKIPGITKLSQERCYWKCMQRLGMYIKVFQFSVVIYDLLVLDFENVKYNLVGGGMLESEDKIRQLSVGMLLIFIGQVLNYTTFQALGAKGVYYGYEFGYSVDRVTCFPYNLHIDDPQYWGDRVFLGTVGRLFLVFPFYVLSDEKFNKQPVIRAESFTLSNVRMVNMARNLKQ